MGQDAVQTPDKEPLRACAASRQGPGRKRNQDAFLSAPDHGLFVLADGIGGLDHGERASWGVVHVLEDALPLPKEWHTRIATLEASLHKANANIVAAGRNGHPPFVMGTTVAAVMMDENEAICFWAGDSRLYLVRDGHLSQVSSDHSQMVTQDESRPPRPMLTRAVGVDTELDIEVRRFFLKPGDRLLLCSDGVHGVLPEPTLVHLALDEEAEDPATTIVMQAHLAGGRDDATAILVRFDGHTLHGTAEGTPDTQRPNAPISPHDAPLQRLERACWEIARGQYGNADQLFDLTVAEDASPTLRQLAESVGFMLVQIEAREMRLTGLIEDLRGVQKQLELANRQLAQENAELVVTVQKLRVDIDRKEFNREVGEIVETEYFQELQRRAREMRARHAATGPVKGAGDT